MYYLGIDGGGAYARAVGADIYLKIIGRHTGNGLDLTKLSPEVVLENLTRLTGEFLKLNNLKAGECESVAVGVPGGDEKEVVQLLKDMFASIGFACPVFVVSDLDISLAAEAKGGPGVLISAATDTRAYARDAHDNRFYCGRFDQLVHHVTSAYGIGLQAVKQALQAFDGRAAKSPLSEKVSAHFGVRDLSDAFEQMTAEKLPKIKISELALIVKYAAEEGDVGAKAIVDAAAAELFQLAKALVLSSKLTEGPVVLSGSVFQLNDALAERVTALLKKEFSDIKVINSREKPEAGAVQLARYFKEEEVDV